MSHLAGINGGKQQQQQYNQLKGPRPPPVNINATHERDHHHQRRAGGPVIVYVKSPDVIHVRPEEFMGLVQSLTGKQDDEAGPNASSAVLASSMPPAPVDDIDFSGRPERYDGKWADDHQAPCSTSNNYYVSSANGNDVNYCEKWEGLEYY